MTKRVSEPVLPIAPPTFRPHGRSVREQERDYDRARGGSSSRLYDWRWSKASKAHLACHPLCLYCQLEGRVTAATLVDHLYPHRGDRVLFWLQLYWVSSCDACHNGMKQSLERQGRAALDALARRLGLPTLST